MATRASTSHLAASDRLYLTPTGYTRAEKKVLEATHFSRTAHGIETEAVEKAVGKTAKVTQIPEHGLVIVRHEAARRGQKQNTELTSTGRRRNDAGGFYSS